MCSAKLQEDLSNCLIDFDRRVLITELLDDYQLSYEEVNTIVENYLIEQESKEKVQFDKRYLVHGLSKDEEHQKEVYKIVEEALLKEWLSKLQNSESSLYSVEVAGGAKATAPIFKPMRVAECAPAKARRAATTSVAAESSTVAAEKKPVKEEKQKEIPAKQAPKTTEKIAAVGKISPKAETTSPGEKAADKKKKGLNNFFAPATSTTTKKPDVVKQKAAVMKPPTPKKVMDFFKKQTEKPASSTETTKKPDFNTSVQLFDDNEEDEPEDVETSDEEDKLEALKRDIISSDIEMEEPDECKEKPKRRRILDSDDEDEDPPVKQEKLEIKEEIKEEEAVAETYLDEDGFVITKKPKQKAASTSSKTPALKKTPPVTIKPTSKDAKKPSSSKETKANPAAKTKQAGIMNFFSKK